MNLLPPRLRPLVAFVAVVALPVVILAFLLTSVQGMPIVLEVVEGIREVAREWWAVPLFVVLYALFALLLLPAGVLSVTAAVAWGWQVGGLIELVAATIGSLPPFLLARRGLPDRINAFLERRGIAPSFTGEPDVFLLFLLRLVPMVPFVAMNYIAGVAKYRTRDYVVMTFAGSIPSVFLFVWFVDTLGAGATGAATQFRVVMACVAIAVAAIIGRAAGRAIRRRWRLGGHEAPPQDDADRRS